MINDDQMAALQRLVLASMVLRDDFLNIEGRMQLGPSELNFIQAVEFVENTGFKIS